MYIELVILDWNKNVEDFVPSQPSQKILAGQLSATILRISLASGNVRRTGHFKKNQYSILFTSVIISQWHTFFLGKR